MKNAMKIFIWFLKQINSSSSSQLVSMYLWSAHSRAVMFHTLHRFKRDTILVPIWFISILCTRCCCLIYGGLLYYSSPSFYASAAADAVSLAPAKSITDCFHHRIPTCAPLFLYATSQRSKIDRVAIYCAAIFCLYQMQVSIGSNPASSISTSAKVYSQLLSNPRHVSLPVSCLINWYWRPPRTRPMLGITTHVSAPNSNTDCTWL